MAGIDRKRLISMLFGLGSALVIALVGPLYGGLMLLLAFPFVFRTAPLVAPAWLLAAFGILWLTLVATGTGAFVRNSEMLDNRALLTALWVAPLVLAGAIVAAGRVRSGSPSTSGRQSP